MKYEWIALIQLWYVWLRLMKVSADIKYEVLNMKIIKQL